MVQEATQRRRTNHRGTSANAQQEHQRGLPIRLVQEHPAPSVALTFGVGVGVGLAVAFLFADSLLGRQEQLSSTEKFRQQFLHALSSMSSMLPERIRSATHC